MTKTALLPLLALTALTALPAAAQAQDNLAAQYFSAARPAAQVPAVLSPEERNHYRQLFAAIRSARWDEVDSLLARRDGLLDPVARAEYYLHPASPRVEGDRIAQWWSDGRRLPQAERLNNLAMSRGVPGGFDLPRARDLQPRGYAPKRILPRGVDDGSMPGSVSGAILDRIKNDDPDGARLLLDGVDASLSAEARAEWRQRVAWSYYIENRDAEAQAMARLVSDGGAGEWVAEGAWVEGLASWRLGDCMNATRAFAEAAPRARNVELAAAAYYWAARSTVRCRMPERAQEYLRGAAALDGTLYGMLAIEQLGREFPDRFGQVDFDADDWRRIGDNPNVRTAIALAEIGEEDLAGEVLRHEAQLGSADDYNAVSRLARGLGLPGTQLWLAHRAPAGGSPSEAAKFPVARWTPVNGWRVDPALAYAHALQESNFQRGVTSPAGAQGLLQIMPIAAREYAPSLGYNAASVDLTDPGVNLAFGQRALEVLSQDRATQGKLPKIMAAYNAGLTPIRRWESEVRDQDDPLLYMESIPYWETRGYVAIVTRNYWMYQRQSEAPSPQRRALAQNAWPMFPQFDGASAGRVYLNTGDR